MEMKNLMKVHYTICKTCEKYGKFINTENEMTVRKTNINSLAHFCII